MIEPNAILSFRHVVIARVPTNKRLFAGNVGKFIAQQRTAWFVPVSITSISYRRKPRAKRTGIIIISSLPTRLPSPLYACASFPSHARNQQRSSVPQLPSHPRPVLRPPAPISDPPHSQAESKQRYAYPSRSGTRRSITGNCASIASLARIQAVLLAGRFYKHTSISKWDKIPTDHLSSPYPTLTRGK